MAEVIEKTGPRSPYVEEEIDEEFLQEENPSENEHERKEPEKDERICRICFSGEEEVENLGTLISPCKCRLSLSCINNNTSEAL